MINSILIRFSKCLKRYFIIALMFPMFISCVSKTESQARKTAENFLMALQEQDVEAMKVYYPDVQNIEVFFACDTFIIENVKPIAENGYKVKVQNYFLNEARDLIIKDVDLYIYPNDYQAISVNIDNNTGYYVTDSYGLCSWKNYPHYDFALNTGCLKKNSVFTDQQAIKRLKIAKELLFYLSRKMHDNMEENIVVTNKKLLSKSLTQAHGCATIVNKSEFTLPDLKYIIQYFDIDNNKIAEEKGWVTKSNLHSGDSLQFSFVTNFQQKAIEASFKLDFDLELILQFVLNDNVYTGDEYYSFITSMINSN